MLVYDTKEQADKYLTGTIVRYQGVPVYVVGCVTKSAGLSLSLTYVGAVYASSGGKTFERPIEDQELDYRIFPLGYLNADVEGMARRDASLHALYISRDASRQQRQGIAIGGNTSLYYGNNQFYRDSVGLSQFISSENFRRLLSGDDTQYSSIASAVEQLKTKQRYSVAISRDIALGTVAGAPHIFFLYHKAERVGNFDHNKNKVWLSRDHFYLEDCFRATLPAGLKVDVVAPLELETDNV